MSAPTITDLFCGAGGSSLGAESAGGTLVMAANHWQTAIDVHQAHFPEAGHDCADISQADPRRYPRTDILLASPECTNHSQARGVSRRQQDPSLWDAPDPDAERSRATMWDVVRFAEQMDYAAIVVENVVEATKWILWPAWVQALTDLGYRLTLLSHNSMHHGVPQSRDRIYCVWTRKGIDVDLEMEAHAHCGRCERVGSMRQAWKSGRHVGRYRQQWVWSCTSCGTPGEPGTNPAADIIDWSLACPRIGDRTRPLADATRARILAGLQRYGWAPIVTSGAGNVHERTPGNRARSVNEPIATQQTTATSALATAPGFLFNPAHGGRVSDLDRPHPAVCASDDRQALVLANNFENVPTTLDHPLPTVTTGNRHGLITTFRGTAGDQVPSSSQPVDQPLRTVSAGGIHHGLIMTGYSTAGNLARRVKPTSEPMPTATTTATPALLMRNNGGGAEMVTPVDEPSRTMTTAGHQSLLLPYYRTGRAQPASQPTPTATTRDRLALVDPDTIVDDCGFRMLEPYEVAAAMAFPVGYIPRDLTKKAQVKLAGNAVTPPVMQWIVGRIIQALERAA